MKKNLIKTEQYLQNSCAMQDRQQHLHRGLQYKKNISVGLLDLVRLKTEPHKNTDEQSDAHVSRSWLVY